MQENKIKKIIDKIDLDRKISEVASILNERYRNDEIVVLGVMNGALFFMHDLIKKIKIDRYEYDFLFCSSYYGRTKSTGKIKFIYPNKIDISNKNVIVLEDIVDTGNTLEFIYNELLKYNPKNIDFLSLLIRENCKTKLNLFWTGYKIKNEFVVGYCLDYKERYRNLEDIYELEI